MYGIKWVLLGVFLIIYGLILAGVVGGSPWTIVAAVCAIIAGVLFLLWR
ncbi:MAG TPA: hypothetical protein VIU38_07840 [Anaerolineales bacterium]|jgi:hypothetical protein